MGYVSQTIKYGPYGWVENSEYILEAGDVVCYPGLFDFGYINRIFPTKGLLCSDYAEVEVWNPWHGDWYIMEVPVDRLKATGTPLKLPRYGKECVCKCEPSVVICTNCGGTVSVARYSNTHLTQG